jgi:2-oxoacid dehydrogenases acyltransferase (catalytic domain)
MSHNPRGFNVPIAVGRRIVDEFLRQARHVPLITVRRDFSIPGLAAVRSAMTSRVSWVALFAKAYAIAALRHERLRRSWTTFPIARLYEHPVSACLVLVEREWQGEEVVLGGKIHEPEIMSLADLDLYVRRFQTAPVRSVSCFRQLLRVGSYPTWLLRFLFWSSLHWSGFRRCKRYGTFVVSSLGSLGCEAVGPRVPLTTYLTYGPVSQSGRVGVALTFDHRVLDGRHAARALEDVERILNTVIAAELRGMATLPPTDCPAPGRQLTVA